MSEPPEIGPELRGLLMELAERPERAGQIARAQRFEDLFALGGQHRLRRSEALLEDHLLRSYREELASLLLDACRLALELRPESVLQHAPSRRRHRASATREDWNRRARPLSQLRIGEESSAVALVEATLKRGLGERPLRDLAMASYRLVPRPSAMIYLAIDASHGGDKLRAVELLARMLQEEQSAAVASCAWTNLARVYADLSRYVDAFEASRKAALLEPEMGYAPLSYLCQAIQVGSVRDAKRAASMSQEVLDGREEIIHAYSSWLKTARLGGVWRPTRDASAVASALSSSASQMQEVLDAFR